MLKWLLKRLLGTNTVPVDPVCNWQLTFISDGPTPSRDLGQVRSTASDALTEAINRHARTLDYDAPHIIVQGAYRVTPAETVVIELGFTYKVKWSPQDNAFVAVCVEFPYFKTHGSTQEEALKTLQEVVELETELITMELGKTG